MSNQLIFSPYLCLHCDSSLPTSESGIKSAGRGPVLDWRHIWQSQWFADCTMRTAGAREGPSGGTPGQISVMSIHRTLIIYSACPIMGLCASLYCFWQLSKCLMYRMDKCNMIRTNLYMIMITISSCIHTCVHNSWYRIGHQYFEVNMMMTHVSSHSNSAWGPVPRMRMEPYLHTLLETIHLHLFATLLTCASLLFCARHHNYFPHLHEIVMCS